MTDKTTQEGPKTTGDSKKSGPKLPDLKQWLNDTKLTKYESKFSEKNVQLEELIQLDQDEVEEFAVSLGLDTIGKKRLVKAVIKLKSTQQSQENKKEETQLKKSSIKLHFDNDGDNFGALKTLGPIRPGGKNIHVIVSSREHEAITRLYERFDRIALLMSNLNVTSHLLDLSSNDCIKDINSKIGNMVSDMQSKKDTLLKDLNTIKEKKEKILKNQLNVLMEYKKEIESFQKQYKSICNEVTDPNKRKDTVLKLIDGILNKENIYTTFETQPKVRLDYEHDYLKSFLQSVNIDDCDQPPPPPVTAENITFESCTFVLSVDDQALQHKAQQFEIQLAIVSSDSRVKNKVIKPIVRKIKKKKKKKKKISDSSDSGSDSDSSKSDSDSSKSDSDDSDDDSDDSDKDSDDSDKDSDDESKDSDDDDDDESKDSDEEDDSSGSDSDSSDSDKKKKKKKKKDKKKKDKEKEKDKNKEDDENSTKDKKDKKVEIKKVKEVNLNELKWITYDYYDIAKKFQLDKYKPLRKYEYYCTKLLDETEYAVRIRAKNQSGWGDYGPIYTFNTPKVVIDSKILGSKEMSLLIKYLPKKDRNKRFKLLYRASKHGFQATNFHQNCDNKTGATICIIKSTQGNIFGGYTTIPWSTSGGYRNEQKSFIFLLKGGKTGSVKKGKFPCKPDRYQYAVSHSSSYGPVFGGGHDICIYSNCNSNTSSYSNAGHSYSCPNDKNMFAGSYNFMVKDYECFLLKK